MMKILNDSFEETDLYTALYQQKYLEQKTKSCNRMNGTLSEEKEERLYFTYLLSKASKVLYLYLHIYINYTII